MLRHGSGSLLLGRDDHGEASALSRAVAGIRIADIPHDNLHVRKGANSSSLSYQFASIATADAWLVLHANGTTNTPSNANAASIAHASLTMHGRCWQRLRCWAYWLCHSHGEQATHQQWR